MSSSSSTIKENFHEPSFKLSKTLPAFPTFKSNDLTSIIVRVFLTLFIITSISFLLFAAITGQLKSLYFSRCDGLNFIDHSALVSRRGDAEKTNISHILFGIGASANTWNSRRLYNELWWKKNITRGFVWLDKKPSGYRNWPRNSPPYKVSADTTKFKYTCAWGSRSAVRITRIVKESFDLGLDNVRWFVLGDDDTVFFTENLVSVLAKYDHNQMYYIGGNSESVEQDVVHSYTMAYGGGGFAISYPLAVELVKILDGCIDRYASFYGSDQKIQACISEIGVPLTKELGFHQVDIRGNAYGLLAAHPIAPLVTLHHLDAVLPIFPNNSRREALKRFFKAYKVDPSRAMQHSFTHDIARNWSVSISWGYTVQLYPSMLSSKKLETAFLTFQSWKNPNQPFTFNTRPLGKNSCDTPLLFFLDRVEEVSSGKTVTTYKRYKASDEKECGRKEYRLPLMVRYIKVSATKLNPDVWKKAPRRQCCEIVRDWKKSQSLVHVKIRSCKRFESVTLP